MHIKKESLGIGIFLVVALLVIGWPFAIIWSLNTLFNLGIANTFGTWLATLVLSVALASSVNSN